MKMTLIEKLARMKEDLVNAYLIPGKIRKAELGYQSKVNTLEMKLAETRANGEKIKFRIAQGDTDAIDQQLSLVDDEEGLILDIARLKKMQADMWTEVDMEGVEK
jgi:hypothetical protein